MKPNIKKIGGLLLTLVVVAGGYWLLADRLNFRDAMPRGNEAVLVFAQEFVATATTRNEIREPDLDLIRLMPAEDDRIVQLVGALDSLVAQHAGQPTLVETAFTALAEGNTEPAEAILSDLYEMEKARPEAELNPVAIAITGRNLSALASFRDNEMALNVLSEVASLDADIALAWARLGHISQREGRDDLAVRAYDMALFLAGDADGNLENRPAALTAHAGLALIGLHAGDRFDTEANGRVAIAIAEELDDRTHLSVLYGMIGRIVLLQGEFDEAGEFQRQALALEEELARPSGLARVNEDLGMVAQLQGDYSTAAEFHQTSLVHHEALGHLTGIARQVAGLGSAMRGLGEIEAACAYWQRALPMFEETRNLTRIEQMHALMTLHEC